MEQIQGWKLRRREKICSKLGAYLLLIKTSICLISHLLSCFGCYEWRMFSFVTFIIMKYQRNLGYKKSCFKHFADVDTSDVYLKSGGKEWGGWGVGQVSSWDLPLAYQGGEKSLFMIMQLLRLCGSSGSIYFTKYDCADRFLPCRYMLIGWADYIINEDIKHTLFMANEHQGSLILQSTCHERYASSLTLGKPHKSHTKNSQIMDTAPNLSSKAT